MGRPPKVTDKEILQEIALARGPVVTAPEIAEALDMGGSGINKRLDELVADGYIKKRTVGSSAVVYWLTPDGRDAIAD